MVYHNCSQVEIFLVILPITTGVMNVRFTGWTYLNIRLERHQNNAILKMPFFKTLRRSSTAWAKRRRRHGVWAVFVVPPWGWRRSFGSPKPKHVWCPSWWWLFFWGGEPEKKSWMMVFFTLPRINSAVMSPQKTCWIRGIFYCSFFIPIFNRSYIFLNGCFSIVMLAFQGVSPVTPPRIQLVFWM